MLTSLQTIAKSQSAVSSAINNLIWFISTPTIQNVFVTGYGSNQFLITVIYNLVGGLRSFPETSNLGMAATRSKLQTKNPRPLFGLKATRVKFLTKNPRPLLGEKVFIEGKQKPTRISSNVGGKIAAAKWKNGSAVSPF